MNNKNENIVKKYIPIKEKKVKKRRDGKTKKHTFYFKILKKI